MQNRCDLEGAASEKDFANSAGLIDDWTGQPGWYFTIPEATSEAESSVKSWVGQRLWWNTRLRANLVTGHATLSHHLLRRSEKPKPHQVHHICGTILCNVNLYFC